MDPKNLQDTLKEIVEAIAADLDDGAIDDLGLTDCYMDLEDATVSTFGEAGIPACGLVISLPDGSQFHLTIVQNKLPDA